MSCYPGNSKVCWKAKGHFSMILDEHAHHIKGGGLAFFLQMLQMMSVYIYTPLMGLQL